MFDIKIIYNKENIESKKAAKRCQLSFNDSNLYPDLFNGVWRDNSDNFLNEYKIKFRDFDFKYSRFDGVVGCFASHYKLWSDIKRPTIILEHDAILTEPNFLNTFIQHSYDIFKNEKIIINLGHPSYGNYETKSNIGIYNLFSKSGKYFPGTHAYAISKSAAVTLIEHTKKNNALPVDLFLNSNELDFLYEFWPWPIRCDDSFSSVQKINGCIAKHNFNGKYSLI